MKLYKLACTVLLVEGVTTSLIVLAMIQSNLVQIHTLLDETIKATQCFEDLLLILMYLGEYNVNKGLTMVIFKKQHSSSYQ
jgi:hypothetical protein